MRPLLQRVGSRWRTYHLIGQILAHNHFFLRLANESKAYVNLNQSYSATPCLIAYLTLTLEPIGR